MSIIMIRIKCFNRSNNLTKGKEKPIRVRHEVREKYNYIAHIQHRHVETFPKNLITTI